MIGDAPGDLEGTNNNVLFYPILPAMNFTVEDIYRGDGTLLEGI